MHSPYSNPGPDAEAIAFKSATHTEKKEVAEPRAQRPETKWRRVRVSRKSWKTKAVHIKDSKQYWVGGRFLADKRDKK